MKMNILTSAAALSDEDLLAHIDVLAGREHQTSAELVAHLAVLRARPALYAGKGYGSLFSYCTQALHLSEDAACNRIEAAKACERFPVILDLLAAGSMTLTSVRILGPHLTPENHQAVLEKAKGRTRPQIDALVAELAPRPDVPTSIRKLPARTVPPPTSLASPVPIPAGVGQAPAAAAAVADPPLVLRPMSPPIVQVLAPGRYGVHFTIDKEAHERLRRVQALLRREIPKVDEAAIFVRALKLLEADLEKTKLGATASHGLSVLGRITTAVTPVAPAATSLIGSSGSCGAATAVNAPSFLTTAGGARSAPSWSSTTFTLMRKGDRPPWKTSPCSAAATTNTRPSSSSVLVARPASVTSAEVSPVPPQRARINRSPAGRPMSRISAPSLRAWQALCGPRFARFHSMSEIADDLVAATPRCACLSLVLAVDSPR